MGVKEDFEKAAEEAKSLPDSVSNDDKLQLYGLYKQAHVGNVNTSRPGFWNQKERAKWDAWKSREGMASEDAMKSYVELVQQLKQKYAQ